MTIEGRLFWTEYSSSGVGLRPGTGQCVWMAAGCASEGQDCSCCWREEASRARRWMCLQRCSPVRHGRDVKVVPIPLSSPRQVPVQIP